MSFRSSVLLCMCVFALAVSACVPVTGVRETSAVSPSTTESVQVDSAYPVTLAHKYGSTTITARPERIVLVGLTEQDALLALGVVPVATREWYGERPGAIFDWARASLGAAEPPVVLGSAELNFEQIVGLDPDVIIGLYAGLTQEEYDTLSKIAPTVAQPAEYVDWGIPWQEATLRIGKIIGESERAEALVQEVEQRFAQARAEYPQFQNASAVIASTWGYPDNYYVYGPQDARGRFLSELGFTIPSEVGDLAGTQFGATISRERLDMVDVDALVWLVSSAEEAQTYRGDDVYQQLRAAQEGRDLFLAPDNPIYDALNFSTVLSLPYAIDTLAPLLANAVDGQPETAVETSP